MKTKIVQTAVLIFCAIAATAAVAFAQTTDSTWTGSAGDGVWSTAMNWDPPIVPNNSDSQTFNVFVDAPDWVTQDIDVTISSLAMQPDNFSVILAIDHNLTVSTTNLGATGDTFGGGGIFAIATQHSNVACSLGNLANFGNNTLTSGNYITVTEGADPGVTSTIRFNAADVRNNNADIQFGGPGTSITDEDGNDAFRHLQHNLVNGIFYMEVGHNFTSEGSFVNEGELDAVSEFGGFEAPTNITINGDYTGIGFPLDPGTNGFAEVVSAGPTFDAKTLIKGNLTNYNPNAKTLNKTYWKWEAAGGRSATTQVLGGSKPLDIVTSQAALILFGPNTGFRDRYGNDALRNLAVSARLLVGDRTFSTAGNFTTTSRLSVFGDTRFNVNGNLTVQSGFFEVGPLTGYAREGEDGFPHDPAYLPCSVNVHGNLGLPSAGILRFHVLDHTATATVSVAGAAVFAGSLQAAVEDVSAVTPSDSYTVLTAGKISGQFSNVRSGGRVDVYSGFTATGAPTGAPVGSFRVTYTKTALTLSDFQPAP